LLCIDQISTATLQHCQNVITIQEQYSAGHSKQKKCKCTWVLFWKISEIELFHCTGVWIWHPILSFAPTILHSLDFCLWGWKKSEVYRTKADTW